MNTKLVFLSILMISFLLHGCTQSTDSRYFDYSGKDGCSPPNIGHRLGGDLDGYSDNSIEGLYAIASLQKSRCFKNWEVDLTESAEGLVLMNSSDYKGVPVAELKKYQLPGVVSVPELLDAFSHVPVSKPIIIDLKVIESAEGVDEAKRVGLDMAKNHNVNVWFIASKANVRHMPEICSRLAPEFDLLLYNRGGVYCD